MDRRPLAGEDIRNHLVRLLLATSQEQDGQQEQRHYFNAFHHAVIVSRLHTLIAFKIRIPVLISNSLAEKYMQNQEIGV